MPSVTSSFKGFYSPTLLKKNVKRFWPLWGLYGLGLFFLLPAPLLSDLYAYLSGSPRYSGVNCYVGAELWSAIQGAPWVGLLYGLLCAMALFHYLMDHRAAQMLHALPIRREGLFLTNWLSGLLFILMPNLVIALLTLGVGSAARAAGAIPAENFFRDTLLWLAAETAIPMFFYCFALCCAMFTGSLLALPVFYGILNVLVMGLYALLSDGLLRRLLAGYGDREPDWCTWFTPAYWLSERLKGGGGNDVLAAVCYCLVAGCAFTLIALGVYRLRQLERAGDLVTVAWVRPVFQYGFALCVGLLLGVFTYEQFFSEAPSALLMALVVLFGAAGAFAGRMLLKKTLRVFAEGWRGVAVMAALLTLLLVGIRADFFGYQRWVPRPDQVEQVTICGVSSYPRDGGSYLDAGITDPALIREVVELHAALVSDLGRVAPDAPSVQSVRDAEGRQTQGSTWLYLDYLMENGEVIRRRYDKVPILQAELEQEGAYARRLEELINRPQLVWDAYLSGVDLPEDGGTVVDGWLDNVYAVSREAQLLPEETALPADGEISVGQVQGEELTVPVIQADTPQEEITRQQLTAQQAQQLWAAIREDLKAGRIGRRYLLDSARRWENCYYSDVCLTLAYTYEAGGRRYTSTMGLSFTVQTTSTATLRALEEMGYGDCLIPRATLG